MSEPPAPHTAAAPRRWLRRPRSWLLLALLAAAGAEGCLALTFHALGRPKGIRYDAALGWRPRPNLAREGAMWGGASAARTNSGGWRDRERAPRAPGGQRRVVVVGDSFTFGVGVADDERFTALLEARLGRTEVLNLGVNGYGTDQQLVALERFGLALAPDVVLCVSYLGNDLADIDASVRHQWPKPWYELEEGELVHHPPQAGPWIRFRDATYVGEVLSELARRAGRTISTRSTGTPDVEALYLALVQRMRGRCEEAGARFLLALVHEPALDPRETARIADRLGALGVEVLDLRPSFEAAGGEGAFLPPPVGHWSPRGHDIVAEALLPHLTER